MMRTISNLFKKQVKFYIQYKGSEPIQITSYVNENLMKVISPHAPCNIFNKFNSLYNQIYFLYSNKIILIIR